MNYTSNGNILVTGCSLYGFAINYITPFVVGDILYLRSQAIKGRLEKVCIKEITIHFPYENDVYHYFVTYVDTWNAFQDERELITYEEALDLVSDYEKKLAYARRKAAKTCYNL